jgi:hypothetical protein
MFEAQMPSMIVQLVAVMKSPTMVFICIGYPKDIDVYDWGEGRFMIEDHSLRCITLFNGELYAIAVNEFEKIVCTNNVQLEQRTSTVSMKKLFFISRTWK